MQLQTINSKSITWQRVPIDCEEYTAAFCADGDGILQLVKYPDRYELLDQLDVIETWPRPTRLRHMPALTARSGNAPGITRARSWCRCKTTHSHAPT
jgi:hypothetical protein